jgi:hypothetical protein
MPRSVIGLCGPAGAGKTTLAKLLNATSYDRMSFADPLKHMISSLLHDAGESKAIVDRMLFGDLKEEPTSVLCGRTPRHAMQTLGTEWRNMIDLDLWTQILETRLSRNDRNVVIDDMRFIHEARMLKQKFGATLAKIIRPGGGLGAHVSEQEWQQISTDVAIVNDGRPNDMLDQLNAFLGGFAHDPEPGANPAT